MDAVLSMDRLHQGRWRHHFRLLIIRTAHRQLIDSYDSSCVDLRCRFLLGHSDLSSPISPMHPGSQGARVNQASDLCVLQSHSHNCSGGRSQQQEPPCSPGSIQLSYSLYRRLLCPDMLSLSSQGRHLDGRWAAAGLETAPGVGGGSRLNRQAQGRP